MPTAQFSFLLSGAIHGPRWLEMARLGPPIAQHRSMRKIQDRDQQYELLMQKCTSLIHHFQHPYASYTGFKDLMAVYL